MFESDLLNLMVEVQPGLGPGVTDSGKVENWNM